MNPNKLIYLLAGAVVAGCASQPAVQPVSTAATRAAPPMAGPTLDNAVERLLGADFSGVVLVNDGSGAPALVRTYGQARRQTQQPVLADTPFQIGSISKWISSVAVLRLVDQGRLDLDTPLGVYLPELPPHSGRTVTLRHLLSNTSGIPNGVMQAYKLDKSIADLRLSHREASVRFASAAPSFPPGSAWDYSPTNWVLVAAVIEQASGTSYAKAVEQLVLGPAGAAATAVPLSPFEDMPAAALAYSDSTQRELAMPPHVTYVAASGTLYSTASDLLRLAQHVYETGLLTPATRTELSRVVVPSQQYALGGRVKLMDLGSKARTAAWHTGSTGAYKSLLAYIPGERKGVVILNNTGMRQDQIGAAGEALLQHLYPSP